jgi:hypothetical protein
MKTIQGIVHNGSIRPSEPLDSTGEFRCLITVFDEDLEELRSVSRMMMEEAKQARLSTLLQLNKLASLTDLYPFLVCGNSSRVLPNTVAAIV